MLLGTIRSLYTPTPCVGSVIAQGPYGWISVLTDDGSVVIYDAHSSVEAG